MRNINLRLCDMDESHQSNVVPPPINCKGKVVNYKFKVI